MAPIDFPDAIDEAYGDIVALGVKLTTENLLTAYARGIFPWPMEGWPLPWFSPERRAILEFKNLHVPRRLIRLRKQSRLRFTIDKDFRAVITHCATVRRTHETGTWITPQIVRAYCELHRLGRAHSVEGWDGERLVGGLYGVDAGGSFGGESMFHLEPNASKLALLFLIEHLQARGLDWLDIQMLTPHMTALGAKEISRAEFLSKLAATQGRSLKLFD